VDIIILTIQILDVYNVDLILILGAIICNIYDEETFVSPYNGDLQPTFTYYYSINSSGSLIHVIIAINDHFCLRKPITVSLINTFIRQKAEYRKNAI
jgi:hypothetical protein